MTTNTERNALLKTFPPCNCGSIDSRGADIGEHSPSCPYHLAALAAFGALPPRSEWVGEVGSPNDWQRGHWMQTFTGRAFYPLDPRVEDIDPIDIAHSLSMQCRYNGHVQRFYSVAEHCVLMSDWFLEKEDEAGPEGQRRCRLLALDALLHDAAEAYCGDMVRPLKIHMPDFCAVDDRLTAVIHERFNLPGPLIHPEVKAADTRILLDERAALLGTPPADWSLGDAQPLGVVIQGWAPERAGAEYLNRLGFLIGALA